MLDAMERHKKKGFDDEWYSKFEDDGGNFR